MATVNVLVRARPLSQRELDLDVSVVLKMEKVKTYLNYVKENEERDKDKVRPRRSFSQKQFLFDRSFWSVNKDDDHFADQAQIFNEFGVKVVKSALDGYNACVFAYGQTGSGKTFTMIGNEDNQGLIPRICEALFKNLRKTKEDQNKSFRVEVSYMEIYNEHVRDLLRRKNRKSSAPIPSLKVREHPKEGPFVQDLTSHPVSDYASIETLLEEGSAMRMTAATQMNSVSSRSHAIVTVKLTQAKFCENIPSETISKVNLVDLAGSERVALSGATGTRLKEGSNINKSLVTLGLIISALAENSLANKNGGKVPRRQMFVPYRDSVLTWLLKDSIGGNSKTVMIATVSPADIHYGETLSTLRYASRARKIVNKPVVNEDPNVKIIRELRAEIEKLQKQLGSHAKNNSSNSILEASANAMEAKLKENEQKADQLTKHWLQKTHDAQKIFKEKCMSLSRQGKQTVLKSAKPHLVGLDVDPLSTDIVIYHLEERKTVIGSSDLSEEQGIALEGSGIEREHCYLEVTKECVTLHPISSNTFVNNKPIESSWELSQGDVIQFGHYLKFRFNNPCEAALLREKRRSGNFSPVSGRMSPAVMNHYRSLDSGLSSPDDFESDLNDTNLASDQVLNSTALSNNSNNSDTCQSRKTNFYIPAHEKEIKRLEKEKTWSFAHDNNINMRANRSMSMMSGINRVQNNSPLHSSQPAENESLVNNGTKLVGRMLKSASTSDILTKPEQSHLDRSMEPRLIIDTADEIYLSSDNILTSERIDDNYLLNNSNNSASDLSLSTDDLACTFLLQSQQNIDTSSKNFDYFDFSYPSSQSLNFPSRTQSMCDISPRKLKSFAGDIIRAGSLFDFSIQKTCKENVFIGSSDGGSVTASALAVEAIEASDILKEKRDQLKELISKYRNAEIERVEAEKENIKRATENEKIFQSQQVHLENLLRQQRMQLEEAKLELEDFKKTAAVEKESERNAVENEISRLMEFKQKHLMLIDGSEHELRKKKFKLKGKIEEYWKRMDLYDNLLFELELDQNKVRRESEGKVLEKMKLFDMQQTEEVKSLREQVKISEYFIETCTKRIENEKKLELQLSGDLETSNVDLQNRVIEAERLYEEVKQQEKLVSLEGENDLRKIDQEVAAEEEKYFKYTIYKMHECDGECSCNENEVKEKNEVEEETKCNITEERQKNLIETLKKKRSDKKELLHERLRKYHLMIEDANNSVVQLRETKLLEEERYINDISMKKDLITALQHQRNEEEHKVNDFQHELRAYERPRSYISDCPEETEEDIVALEQQKLQLLQSKEKIRTMLEKSLQEEFSALKTNQHNVGNPYNVGKQQNEDLSSVDQALSLIFHSGNSSAYINSIVTKHVQYETRKQLLSDIKHDLDNLKRHQVTIHQEVASNFLTQKSVFEAVRSKERKDIHDAIHAIVSTGEEDNAFADMFATESKYILAYQEHLETLENEMYIKIQENQRIQAKLDELQDKMSDDASSINEGVSLSLHVTLEEEMDALQTEKEKCECMIQDLKKKVLNERKEYLEMLKSKDEYDVIGQEFRDARHTFFQTEGNQAASEVLREVFWASNVMDAIDKSITNKSFTCAGWRYVGTEKNVRILKKTSNKGTLCILGQGIIKTAPKDVWQAVRNPLSRLIYDNMVKKLNVVEHCNEHLKVVYFQHESRVCLLKQTRDCCCVHSERVENNKYVAAFKSVEHPDCPETKKCTRSYVYPSGWVVESYTENGEDWSMLWYVLKIDLGKGLPKYFLNSLLQKIPLSISYLRDYLVLS